MRRHACGKVMDFNIIFDDAAVDSKVKKAFELGYTRVAVNTVVDSKYLEEKNVKIPEPKEVIVEHVGYKKYNVLNRVTAVIKDGIHGHHLMQCATAKRYDIIAVQPVGEKMLQHVCANMDVDIISLNLAESLNFSLKRTYLNQARDRGITFEIQYGPCLRDQTARRWVITNSQMLVDVLKGKNIIVSSGALKIMELRGVHDVVNLCHLFGFKMNMAKAAVLTNGLTVLSHSGTRLKTGCGYVSVEDMFRLSNQHRWLVSACSVPKKDISNKDNASGAASKTELSDTQPSKKLKLEKA